MNKPQSFGEQLKFYRHRANVSQEKLAEMSHVSPQTISTWERDRNQPNDRNTLKSLIKALVKLQGITEVHEADGLIRSVEDGDYEHLRSEEIEEVFAAVNVNRTYSRIPYLDYVVGHEERLKTLKSRLGLGNNKPQKITIVWGWPGVGKTTLMASLAQDKDVVRFFSNVYWVSLGPENDSEVKDIVNNGFNQLARQLQILSNDKEKQEEERVIQFIDRIVQALYMQSALLIVDDPYSLDAAIPFKLIADKTGCSLLVATRIRSVTRLSGKLEDVFELKVLDEESAVNLFNYYAPEVGKRHISEVIQLLKDLEYLPLAIRIAAPLLEEDFRNGFDPTSLMKRIHQVVLKTDYHDPMRYDPETGKIPSVSEVFSFSTDRLDAETRYCFAQLGVLKEKPAKFDLQYLEGFWEVEDVAGVLRKLIENGLVQPSENRYWIHALLKSHAFQLLSAWNE